MGHPRQLRRHRTPTNRVTRPPSPDSGTIAGWAPALHTGAGHVFSHAGGKLSRTAARTGTPGNAVPLSASAHGKIVPVGGNGRSPEYLDPPAVRYVWSRSHAANVLSVSSGLCWHRAMARVVSLTIGWYLVCSGDSLRAVMRASRASRGWLRCRCARPRSM